ncbi:hypothetical protein ACWCYY_30590 [Kitasatospora sp. NPDC001664]
MRTVLRTLASSRALGPEHIDALIDHGDPDVLSELCRRSDLTPRQLDALVADGGRAAFLALVRSGAMPEERIPADDPEAQLAAVGRPDPAGAGAARLADRPVTEERSATLRILAGDPDCAVAAAAVRLLEEVGVPDTRRRPEACVRIAIAGTTADGETLRGLLAVDGPPPLVPCPHRPDPDAALAELRSAAVRNRHAPADAVEELLDATWPALAAQAAACWAGLRPETYERLLGLDDPRVTAAVAGGRGTPARLIRHLFDADGGRWRGDVLGGVGAVPLDLLVREALAGRGGGVAHHRDVDGLAALAEHSDPRVRMLPLDNVHLRPEVLARLVDDPDPAVALRAALRSRDPERLRAAAERFGPGSHTPIARELWCPADLLLTVAQDRDTPFEEALVVADHRNATPEVLDACLDHHPGPEMDEAVVENQAASPEQLDRLVRGGVLPVLRAAARNPELPPRVVDAILALALGPRTPACWR